MRLSIVLTASAVLLLPTLALASEAMTEPSLVFHPLATTAAHETAESGTEQLPPPVLTRFGATLEASGQLRYECRNVDNPSYIAYRARIDAALRGEVPR